MGAVGCGGRVARVGWKEEATRQPAGPQRRGECGDPLAGSRTRFPFSASAPRLRGRHAGTKLSVMRALERAMRGAAGARPRLHRLRPRQRTRSALRRRWQRSSDRPCVPAPSRRAAQQQHTPRRGPAREGVVDCARLARHVRARARSAGRRAAAPRRGGREVAVALPLFLRDVHPARGWLHGIHITWDMAHGGAMHTRPPRGRPRGLPSFSTSEGYAARCCIRRGVSSGASCVARSGGGEAAALTATRLGRVRSG
eukprot:249054-Chlamydomonas_euryale.AAC.2